ncbi:MAG: hypothetical protein J5862_03095, partial [Bacteroidales bacterium]|nr:hypothetical protein [Bacteroidales bacterium]
MKRIILIMICLALATACAWAQEDVETEAVPLPKSLRQGVNVKKNEAERKVKFLVGGYFGFSIGHNTSVEVSPHFGIMPIKYLAIGIGGTYIYITATSLFTAFATNITFGARVHLSRAISGIISFCTPPTNTSLTLYPLLTRIQI